MSNIINPGDYLTTEQVAARSNVSARTIDRWRKTGKLPEPHRLLGRLVWHIEDLTTWENNQ